MHLIKYVFEISFLRRCKSFTGRISVCDTIIRIAYPCKSNLDVFLFFVYYCATSIINLVQNYVHESYYIDTKLRHLVLVTILQLFVVRYPSTLILDEILGLGSG